MCKIICNLTTLHGISNCDKCIHLFCEQSRLNQNNYKKVRIKYNNSFFYFLFVVVLNFNKQSIVPKLKANNKKKIKLNLKNKKDEKKDFF